MKRDSSFPAVTGTVAAAVTAVVVAVPVAAVLLLMPYMDGWIGDDPAVNYAEILDGLEVDYTFPGDMHFEPVDSDVWRYSMTMEHVKKLEDGSIEVRFSQNDYTHRNGYQPAPDDFVFTARYEINDTFVPVCYDYTDPLARETLYDDSKIMPRFDVLKYMGTVVGGGVEYFVFYYHGVRAVEMVPCLYPEVIEQSHNAVDLKGPEELTQNRPWVGDYVWHN